MELAERLLAGDRRAAGRAISLIEDGDASVEAIMRAIYPRTGNAYAIGITGPPGGGKSTLVDELVSLIRVEGQRVGVIAVDPNSPFSGGAVLGDRIRMMRHSLDSGVFIRSMGARGHLGGLALATHNSMLALDALGMDEIIAETVGVGQSELEVADTTDTTIVVIPPGLGDGVQAIKAGIMEIADIFVVNKADHPQADRTVADIRDLLRMERGSRDWIPPIVRTVATEGTGVADLWTRVRQHRHYLEKSGQLDERRRLRLRAEIMRIATDQLQRRVLEPTGRTDEFRRMLDQVAAHQIDPYQAAEKILEY
ncbi:MAG: methylmalonyl Co-A mutase-associated GTPase MeaB [Chloroflexota bacterium]